MIEDTHKAHKTIHHEHFCSKAPHRGEPAWLMAVECEDGRWFLEAEFAGEWPNAEGVSRPGVSDVEPEFFPDRPAALRRAASLITQRFETDLEVWLKEAESDD